MDMPRDIELGFESSLYVDLQIHIPIKNAVYFKYTTRPVSLIPPVVVGKFISH